MSRISNVSSKLGEYMLKGYVLTDEGCPICSIPMLRTPSGQLHQQLFCSQCEYPPNAQPAQPSTSTLILPNEDKSIRSPLAASNFSSSTGEPSGVSTPPTELSSGLSSPTFPPVDTAEAARRRAQSDMASAEIGKRMLQGWAMLAEECPNDLCYGVPLLRPPRARGEKDPRKICVICDTVYVFHQNESGQNVLTPQVSVNVNQKEQDATRIEQHVNHREHGNTAVTVSIPRVTASTTSTLNKVIGSLEQSLDVLASRIIVLSGQIPLNHAKIAEVASSIEQVTNALRTVKHLHFQENAS